MGTRHQRGYVFRKGSVWYLRYYDTDASGRRRQFCRALADYSDPYRTKKDVRPLAEDFLRPLNEGRVGPESTLPVEQYVDEYYFPGVAERLRASTLNNYRNIWKTHLRHRLSEITLRDFRCVDGERLLADISHENRLGRATFHQIKSLMSGIFKFAKRQGILDGINPMVDVSIPTALKPPSETYAYTLDEVLRMLKELPEPAKTVVAVAAFAGLSRSEIRGLIWEDYHDDALFVRRGVWRRHVAEPKTPQRKAPAPVIPLLAERLDAHRGVSHSGPIFHAINGQPLSLDNLARRTIIPALRLSGLEWHGWHAFRRGLATNLKGLGVDDDTIQKILRHRDVSTTQRSYIKIPTGAAIDAMEKLEKALRDKAPVN